MDIKLLLQIAGVLLGLLYLWLEYRADIRLWIVGLVMPLIHGALYYKSGLYADCSMQAYYVLAGLYGWLVWRRRGRKTDAGLTGPEDAEGAKRAAALRIGHTPLRTVPALAGVYAAAHIGLYLLLTRFTAPYPSGTRGPRRCRSWRCGCCRASWWSNGSCGWSWIW